MVRQGKSSAIAGRHSHGSIVSRQPSACLPAAAPRCARLLLRNTTAHYADARDLQEQCCQSDGWSGDDELPRCCFCCCRCAALAAAAVRLAATHCIALQLDSKRTKIIEPAQSASPQQRRSFHATDVQRGGGNGEGKRRDNWARKRSDDVSASLRARQMAQRKEEMGAKQAR